jgi:hypothetical protein
MGGSDETKFDHPTQKPVELMRRHILNHLRRSELVYEPFYQCYRLFLPARHFHMSQAQRPFGGSIYKVPYGLRG